MTGRYEPTGFKSAPAQPKRNIVLKKTGRGIEAIDVASIKPGTVLPAPVTKPGGRQSLPPAGGGLPTEDERKAAGWFAQAENAWNNMSNIIKKTREQLSRADGACCSGGCY